MCICSRGPGVYVFTAIGLIRVVLAVIVAITDVRRVGADACTTLELAWSALKLGYSDKTQHIINRKKQNNILQHWYVIMINGSQAAIITHGSLQAHLSGPHSHLQCHTSTKMECTCHFCRQT